MATILKNTIDIPIDGLTGIEKMFGKIMKMETANIPKKFEKAYWDTKNRALENLKIKGVYGSFEIDRIADNQIFLQSGSVLDSRMYAKIFSDATELFFGVVSVHGYEELEDGEENMLAKVFLDSWGSSIVDSAYDWLLKNIKDKLAKQGLNFTSSFSPGQHDVPLNVQETIFKELNPEQIGVTINSYYLMQPKKSVSGAFGFGPGEIDSTLRPCDFCTLRQTCPGAYAEF